MNQRTHIVIPRELVDRIDAMIGKRGRSTFLVGAASRELKRLEQIKALKQAQGIWKSEDHPELSGGSAKWVHSLRAQESQRGH